MAIVSSSLFKNTALRSAVYSDRGAMGLSSFEQRPMQHKLKVVLERLVSGFAARMELWSQMGLLLNGRLWAGERQTHHGGRGCRMAVLWAWSHPLVLSHVSQHSRATPPTIPTGATLLPLHPATSNLS